MEENNIYKITNNKSEAVFRGSKLIKLNLNGVQVINAASFDTEADFLVDGSYFMFPWVGRLDGDSKIKEICKLPENYRIDYPFKDGKSYPLHGFYANSGRVVELVNLKTIIFKSYSEGKFYHEHFPSFEETYTIEENSLTVVAKFLNKSSITQYFAFGYHPYIELQGQVIDTLDVESNINKKCKLDENVLPYERKVILEDFKFNNSIGNQTFDDLFYSSEGTYISLSSSLTGKTVTVKSLACKDDSRWINLNYFQLYTPGNRLSIAIEPMSSPCNAFNIDFPNHLVQLESMEEKQGGFTISMSSK